MPAEKLLNLYKQVATMTKAGEMEWVPTANENEYIHSLEKSSFIVGKIRSFIEVAIYFRVLNAAGNVIDSFSAVESERDYAGLEDLYVFVERKASKVDEQLDEITKRLNERKKTK